MGRWSGQFAAASSARRSTPTTLSRPPSWSCSAGPDRSAGPTCWPGGCAPWPTRRPARRSAGGPGAGPASGCSTSLPEPARADDPPRDWLPLFDAAVQRLPAKYREPVVLCELQGLSRRDASARLGLTEGTLSSRLGRARDLLRRRLGPYGFPLAIGSAVAPAVVPEALTASTAAAAVHVSAASVSAVVLSEGVLTAMLASKLKAGALAGTAVVVLGVVAGLPFAGPVSGAGGPPAKDGVPTREVAKEAPTAGGESRPEAGPPSRRVRTVPGPLGRDRGRARRGRPAAPGDRGGRALDASREPR